MTRRRLLGADVRFWSLHSWSWDDRLADGFVAARIEELTSWLVGELPAAGGGGGRVVDLGCGTGNHSWAMAAAGVDVVGVDFAPGMLARAAAKGATASREVAFVRADLRRGLALRPGTFDGALSIYSAQFFDLAGFATEVASLLRPGGAFVAELPRPGTRRRRSAAPLSLRHRGFQRVNGAAAFVGERLGLVRVLAPDDVDAALGRAGFSVVGHRDTDRSLAVLARLSA